MQDAIERRDLEDMGRVFSRVWELNKKVHPATTNERVEQVMDRIAPHAAGAKLLGAGGGGFLLIICPDDEAASACRAELEAHPPNERARFFDYTVNEQGLQVTVS